MQLRQFDILHLIIPYTKNPFTIRFVNTYATCELAALLKRVCEYRLQTCGNRMRKRAHGLWICGYGLKKRRYGLQNVSARIGYSLVWFINPWARFVKPREQCKNSCVRFINLWARFVKPRGQFKNSWVRFINWGDELQNCHHGLFVFFLQVTSRAPYKSNQNEK